jgi:type II secretory ATPase GspE/PulE/Tfp pilus assembly ATPase PilB-like protein
LFLLENIGKEQGCYESRYQNLKTRTGIKEKMEFQKEEQRLAASVV